MSFNKTATLSDVCSLVDYGYTESATAAKVGPKFLRITDIQGGKVEWSSVPYCTIDAKNKDKYLLKQGDIVIARTGNSTGENYLFESNEDAVFASYLIRFRVSSSIANPRFVWYQLRTKSWLDFISTNKTGSAQAGANAKVLGNFPLYLPSLEEQKRISAFFKHIDDCIRTINSQNTTLEAIAQTLFRSWFVNFDPVHAKSAGQTPEGMSPELAVLFPSEFVESELGMVPKGWVHGQLSKLVIFNPTLKIAKSSEVSFTEMAALPTQGHQIDTPFKRQFSSGAKFQNGDTLFARITPCLENGKTGLVDYLQENEVGGGSTEFIVMRPADKTPCLLPYIIARNEDFRAYAQHFMTGTSGRQRVDWKDLARYPITYSEKALQAFESVTGSFAAQLKINRQLSSALSDVRDGLLPHLISGKLRIEEAEEAVAEVLGTSNVEEKAA